MTFQSYLRINIVVNAAHVKIDKFTRALVKSQLHGSVQVVCENREGRMRKPLVVVTRAPARELACGGSQRLADGGKAARALSGVESWRRAAAAAAARLCPAPAPDLFLAASRAYDTLHPMLLQPATCSLLHALPRQHNKPAIRSATNFLVL